MQRHISKVHKPIIHKSFQHSDIANNGSPWSETSNCGGFALMGNHDNKEN